MSIWDKYPDLRDDEIRTLVVVTAQSLLESETATRQLPQELLEFSPLQASRELLPLLREREPTITIQHIQDALEDEDTSLRLSFAILDEVKKHPELAAHVAAQYEHRTWKMAVPELMLLAGSLAILAIKLKEIRWTASEKKISFYESSQIIKDFLTGLIKDSRS